MRPTNDILNYLSHSQGCQYMTSFLSSLDAALFLESATQVEQEEREKQRKQLYET